MIFKREQAGCVEGDQCFMDSNDVNVGEELRNDSWGGIHLVYCEEMISLIKAAGGQRTNGSFKPNKQTKNVLQERDITHTVVRVLCEYQQ